MGLHAFHKRLKASKVTSWQKNTDERKARAVPSSRIGRVGRLGALAGKIAGNVVTNGASQWIKGERPALSALLLTPKKILPTLPISSPPCVVPP